MATRAKTFLFVAAFLALGLGSDRLGHAEGVPMAGGGQRSTTASSLMEYLQTELITMDLKDAELANVLRIISAQYDLNIVAGEDVVGRLSVNFRDATLAGALNAILTANGYGYLVDGNIIRVATKVAISEEQIDRQKRLELEGLLTEVFFLKYLDAKDTKEVLMPMLSPRGKITVVLRKGFKGFQFGQIAQLGGGGGSSSSSSTSSSSTSSSGGAAAGGSGLSGSGEGGEKSSILLVQDVAAVIAKMKTVLAQIDSKPRQILIKARLFEINADDLRDFGLELSTGSTGLTSSATPPITSNKVKSQQIIGTEPAPTQLQAGTIARFFDSSGDFIFGRDGQDGLQMRFQRLTGFQYDTMIKALESNVDFNELSSPSIMVLENQEAAILVGEQFPIFQVQAASDSTASPVESLDFFQPIGISLQVIPQIVSEDHINMVIHPSVSSIGATVTGSTGLTAPRITIREADTQVMIRNGETIVIGGMLQDRTRDRVVGIPFLMDVPYLGNLVKRTKTDVTKVELLMFITPNIVTGNQFTDREKVVYQKTAEIEEVKSDESWDVIRRKLKKQFME